MSKQKEYCERTCIAILESFERPLPKATRNKKTMDLFGRFYSFHSNASKKPTLTCFKDGSTWILRATLAFVMGVHIPDVKNVIHRGPSDQLFNL